MPSPKNVHGFWLPEGEEHLLKFAKGPGWTYQKHKLDKAMTYVEEHRVAIDVGGHCGLWSVHLVKMFQWVYAFEPVEAHRECFKLNVTEENVELLPYALGEKTQTVHIRTKDHSSGDSRVAEEGIPVDMQKLDFFAIKNVDFIKIDCEGYEYFVLKGGEETIDRYRPVIVVEQKKGFARQYGIEPLEAVDWLKKKGYQERDVISGDYIMTP